MESLIASVMRGERPAWPFGGADEAAAFVEAAARHGAHSLVADMLARFPHPSWPAAVVEELRRRAIGEAVQEAVREGELRRVLSGLHWAGVPNVIIKGAAVGRTHYERPDLRPRFDVDLMIQRERLAAAVGVLEGLGYRRMTQTSGQLVMHQADYSRVDDHGLRHVVDLHWKLVNPHVLADSVPFEDIDAEAVDLPGLGEGARAPSALHSLFIACIHRAAHHADEDRLIWLYDIHLLAATLDEWGLDRFGAEARRRKVAAVTASGLARARQLFNTALPARFIGGLEAAAAGFASEPSSGFARGAVTRLDVLVSDLRALDSWRDRLALVREHVLPPPAYIMRSYGVTSRAALPALYAHRLVCGAWKWLRREV
ncbi:MAG: nucleotidyltransferase family protein [Vicinamibacterales bacterium]